MQQIDAAQRKCDRLGHLPALTSAPVLVRAQALTRLAAVAGELDLIADDLTRAVRP